MPDRRPGRRSGVERGRLTLRRPPAAITVG
jgi:hypothetical protein